METRSKTSAGAKEMDQFQTRRMLLAMKRTGGLVQGAEVNWENVGVTSALATEGFTVVDFKKRYEDLQKKHGDLFLELYVKYLEDIERDVVVDYVGPAPGGAIDDGPLARPQQDGASSSASQDRGQQERRNVKSIMDKMVPVVDSKGKVVMYVVPDEEETAQQVAGVSGASGAVGGNEAGGEEEVVYVEMTDHRARPTLNDWRRILADPKLADSPLCLKSAEEWLQLVRDHGVIVNPPNKSAETVKRDFYAYIAPNIGPAEYEVQLNQSRDQYAMIAIFHAVGEEFTAPRIRAAIMRMLGNQVLNDSYDVDWWGHAFLDKLLSVEYDADYFHTSARDLYKARSTYGMAN